MEFENTITINRPRNVVFAYLAGLEHLPEWNYAIRRTAQLTPGPVQIGTKYTQERTLPHAMTESLEITDFKPDSLLQISGGFGPFPFGVSTYQLETTGDDTLLRNHIRVEAKGPLALIAPLKMPAIKSAVAQNLRVLKEILESSPDPTI